MRKRWKQGNNTRAARLRYQAGLLSFARLGTLARIVRLGGGIDRRYSGRALLILASSLLQLPVRLFESLRHGRRIARTEIGRSPIFVIGHWRSGTTHLHNLLSQDPALGCLRMHQAIVPEGSLIGRSWTRALMSRLLPAQRPMDSMAFTIDVPQEEEIPLTKLTPHSFYWQFMFPRRARELFDSSVLMQGLSERARRSWRGAFLRLLRVATIHAGGRRLVLKNPVNTARIPELLELFPDAKFVFIHRSPYRVFLSTRNLHEKIFAFSALQETSDVPIGENVVLFYRRLMQKYLRDRARVPLGNLVEVRFEDLEREPMEVLRRIYTALGLPGFDQAEPALRTYIETQASYQKNQFELCERDRRRVERDWSFAFDAWHYPRLGPVTDGDLGESEAIPFGERAIA